MGSNSKKTKDKEGRKRRHRSRSDSSEREVPKEKKHRHHKRHHRERKREKLSRHYESEDSDVIEVEPDYEDHVPTPPPPRIVSTSPEPTRQSTESLSIEETNKLRAKLGLKPLQIDDKLSSSSNQEDRKKGDIKRKDEYGEFYHKPATNISAKMEQEKIRARLTEHKEKRNLDNKLSKVKLLADESSDDDASAWITKFRHLEEAKLEAEKRAKMLEELDAQFGVSEIVESEKRNKLRQKYTEKNLLGLRVEHDTESFVEDQTVILTLKDQEVLAEEEDVLMNVNMIENERYKKNNEIRKRRPGYLAFDEDELDEFGNPKEKSLLAKYDEEIDGEMRKSFKIGSDNAIERKQALLQSVKNKLANKQIETLARPELKIASDYYTEEEMLKFKKTKKKNRTIRTKGKILTADDLEGYSREHKIKQGREHVNIDNIPYADVKPDIKFEEENDDVLERALQKTRKLKQKENIAKDIVSSPPYGIKMESAEDNVDFGNIVLNATAEFCRTLGDIPTYGKSGNREDTEDMLDYEKDCPEIEMEQEEVAEEGKWNAVDPNRMPEAVVIEPIEIPILDEEPDVGSGVGAALKLAMSKGYLDKEEKGRPSNSRLAHLQAQHYSIEDKSYGEDFERGSRRERYAGPISDFKEKDTFKPNVKLEYIDDEGRVLNSKEAFRYLSHKFHGKGPGKNKIEKRLKKTQQEGLMKKMSSTDTPLGTLNMLQAKQREMQTPYIVLSGGKHTHSTSIAKAHR